jgi:hypothetical protein
VNEDHAVARFKAASEADDIAGMLATLAPDAELVSPLSAKLVFRGGDDIGFLLAAVYGTLTGVRWLEEMGEGSVRTILGEARIGPLRMGDAMILELAEDGRIHRIRPHLRPWLATTVFALVIGTKVARRPGAVLRALR